MKKKLQPIKVHKMSRFSPGEPSSVEERLIQIVRRGHNLGRTGTIL